MNRVTLVSLHVQVIMQLGGCGARVIVRRLNHRETSAQTFVPRKSDQVWILQLLLVLVHNIDKLRVGVEGCAGRGALGLGQLVAAVVSGARA